MSSKAANQVLVIEEASLEIVPPELRHSREVAGVRSKFGVRPELQILDRNFHSRAMTSLKGDSQKRGRPDVVHFALLDATSTPLFRKDKVLIMIHTIHNDTIELESGTRPPRTLQRFCGVMAKILSGSSGQEESKLFSFKRNQTFDELLQTLEIESCIGLTKKSMLATLSDEAALAISENKRTAWIVGGFPRGNFLPKVEMHCNKLISISELSLPAHVVTARLCYEIEKNLEKSS